MQNRVPITVIVEDYALNIFSKLNLLIKPDNFQYLVLR